MSANFSNFSFEQLFTSWRAASGHKQLNPPGTAEELRLTEEAIGRPLPDQVKRVYSEFNGVSIGDGGLRLHPLIGEPFSVASMNEYMCQGTEPFPASLRVFGDDGSDANYMFWSGPAETPFMTPVVNYPMVDEPECYSLVGTSFLRFLVAYTLVDRCFWEDFAPVEILGLPRALFSPEPDEVAILTWVDPHLPHPGSDILYSEDGLRKIFTLGK